VNGFKARLQKLHLTELRLQPNAPRFRDPATSNNTVPGVTTAVLISPPPHAVFRRDGE
jgi:hypothetical protein